MEQAEKAGRTGGAAQPHQLILQERQRLELSGVSDVESFDDAAVAAYTTQGELIISGSGLHISRLDLESGLLSLEGQIDMLQYRESTPKGSFFGRLFR